MKSDKDFLLASIKQLMGIRFMPTKSVERLGDLYIKVTQDGTLGDADAHWLQGVGVMYDVYVLVPEKAENA